MGDINDQIQRYQLGESLRANLEATIEKRIGRYLEVRHQNIIPGHHFAAASTECIELYRDGYFLSALMVSQAVAEGIFRFVLERKSLQASSERLQMAQLLVSQKILSPECAKAFGQIWGGFRNDVHHMNPKVAHIPFADPAKRNLHDLSTIEQEVFAYRVENGRLLPVQPKYWDPNPDGTIPVFLRLE